MVDWNILPHYFGGAWHTDSITDHYNYTDPSNTFLCGGEDYFYEMKSTVSFQWKK